MEFDLEVSELCKIYDSTKAVDNLSFSIPKGSLTGFLGPNGAGKTTTIRMLVGLLKPTSGSVRIFGFDIRQSEPWIRTKIGYIPENLNFPPELNADSLLHMYGRMCGLPKNTLNESVSRLIELVGLRGEERKKIGKYSKGMVQRLGFAHALLNEPHLLVLDEPLIGLDPPGIVKFRDLIKELNKNGTTVFLSSHILHEVQQTCMDIIIIDKGRVVKTAKVSEIRVDAKAHFKTLILELKEVTAEAIDLLEKLPYATELKKIGSNTIKLSVQTADDIREQLFHALVDAGIVVYSMKYDEASLEDILLDLIKRGNSKEN